MHNPIRPQVLPMREGVSASCVALPAGPWVTVIDFLVQRLDGTLEIHETKGFMMEDAQIKLKMLTKDYPFRVLVVRRKKGGIWEWETYEP